MQSLYICLQNGELVTISEISLKKILKKLDKLTVKLTLTYLVVSAVVMSIFAGAVIGKMSDNINSDKRRELAAMTQELASFAEDTFSGSKKALAEELALKCGSLKSEDIKVSVIDRDLKTIYTYGDIGKNVKSKSVSYALEGESLFSDISDDILDYSCPIVINDEIIGVANSICSFDEGQYVRRIIGPAVLWIILALFVSGLVVFAAVHIFSKRIRYMTDKISEMSNDNRAEKPQIKGSDEIAGLCRSFNDFSEKVSVLERQRTEFVSNASHELKTPLSSIKLMADSIIQTPDIEMDYVREFLSDMNDEVERLNRIVNKLLYITKMDTLTENMSGTLELINLKDVVSGINKNLIPLAEMENKEIVMNADEDILIMANKDILWQAIYNIIDNALKYTSPDGKVEVTLTKESKRAVITVKDNGVGIAEEDVDRIFDRFYRVDKARSRATGGTGLGLSIAQSAIEFHNGSIEVTSQINVGSEFKIILPLVEWF